MSSPVIWGPGIATSLQSGGLLIGGVDGGSPSAATLRVSDATGNSVAGANLVIQPGNGTGLGGSGVVTIQTATAASSSPPAVGSINQTSTTSGTSLTLTGYTVALTSDRLLIVAVSTQNGTAVTGVTYGGTPLIALDSQLGASSTTLTALYYLIAPTVGSANLVATTAATTQIILQAYVVSNANQTAPFGTVSKTSGSATSASLTPASVVGDTVIDFISSNASATVSGGQTLIQNGTTGAGVLATEASKAGTAGTTSMSYSFGGTANFAYLAVAVKPTANNSPNTMVERLRVSASGNVGVNATNPQTTLQVGGVISPATDNTFTLGSPSFRFTTIHATNATINTSDAREKIDILDTDLGLDFIKSIRPVSFKWAYGPDTEQHYGVIAQEMEVVLEAQGKTVNNTSIVEYDMESDRYGVRYTELIAPMMKAIQELSAKNEELQARIMALEAP